VSVVHFLLHYQSKSLVRFRLVHLFYCFVESYLFQCAPLDHHLCILDRPPSYHHTLLPADSASHPSEGSSFLHQVPAYAACFAWDLHKWDDHTGVLRPEHPYEGAEREDERQGHEASCRQESNSQVGHLRMAHVQAGWVVVAAAEAFQIHHQRWEAQANHHLAIQAVVAARAEDIALASDVPFLDRGKRDT
jgi:hypothetical protein